MRRSLRCARRRDAADVADTALRNETECSITAARGLPLTRQTIAERLHVLESAGLIGRTRSTWPRDFFTDRAEPLDNARQALERYLRRRWDIRGSAVESVYRKEN